MKCLVAKCEKDGVSRGWCRTHYHRWYRTGTTDQLRTRGQHINRRTPIEPLSAFESSHRILPNGCWEWTGRVNEKGYSRILVNRKWITAHKWNWQRLYGPVPHGLELDHVCHSKDPSCSGGRECPHRRCVNPAHLEPVHPVVNNVRSRRWADDSTTEGGQVRRYRYRLFNVWGSMTDRLEAGQVILDIDKGDVGEWQIWDDNEGRITGGFAGRMIGPHEP